MRSSAEMLGRRRFAKQNNSEPFAVILLFSAVFLRKFSLRKPGTGI
jgi:hypothetical protein